MKQKITSEQIDELTEGQRKVIQDWYIVSEGDYIAYKAHGKQKKWVIHLNFNDTDYGWDREPGTKLTSKYEFPALSVGQMIEFIYKHRTVDIESEERESPMMGWTINNNQHALKLVDALWRELKDILCKK